MSKVDLRQFHEKQVQAIGFLSMPAKGGLQFDEIAERCGISVRQLHRWRKNPDFKQAVIEQSLENVKEELPDVLKAHKKQATKGNVKAIELFYKLFGLLVERQEIEQTVSNKEMDNDSLQRELDDLKNLIDDTQGEQ